MKFDEIYVPVFTESADEKARQLRADYGSRKVNLMCSACNHEFTKRVGPNTPSVACPECGNNRVKPALSEVAKQKLKKMKDSIDEGAMTNAVHQCLEILDTLYGKTDETDVKIMQDAFSGLISIERGLGSIKEEIDQHIAQGTGVEIFKDIAHKLGRKDLFNGEDDE